MQKNLSFSTLTNGFTTPLKLTKQIKNYAWGKDYYSSYVTKFSYQDDLDKSLPYAELWIGNHTNAPSKIVIKDREYNFSELLNKHPIEILGSSVYKKFGTEFPFLLKILSVGKPLSIQSHPSKELARQLRAKDPKNYHDENHKPEIAVALTEMEMLYGIREMGEIENFLSEYKLSWLANSPSTGSGQAGAPDANYSKLFSAIFNLEKNELILAISTIKNTITSKQESVQRSDLTKHEKLFLKQISEYPEDPGLIILFFLNIIELKPSDVVFTDAHIPHAYLSGDLIECMANSDNVIRVGLTPKFIDKDAFCESLILLKNSVETTLLQNTSSSRNISVYTPPIDEFFLRIHRKNSSLEIEAYSCEVIFSLDGVGSIELGGVKTEVLPGDVFLIPCCFEKYRVSIQDGMAVSVGVPEHRPVLSLSNGHPAC